jgi:hypothetical protein
MTRQYDFLEDVADQMSGAPNVGERDERTRGWHKLSPALRHAKVDRERPAAAESAPSAPVDSPSPPEAVPAVPRVINTREDLLELLRERRDELRLTHEQIDHLAGWASGYASKVLSPEPLKQLGEHSLSLVLGALALGIARIEFVEDPVQAVRMRPRWTPRQRPKMRPRRTRGALLTEGGKESVVSTTEDSNVEPQT